MHINLHNSHTFHHYCQVPWSSVWTRAAMCCVSVLLIPSRPENDQLCCKLLWVKNSVSEHLPVALITIYTGLLSAPLSAISPLPPAHLLSSCPAPALIWWGQGAGGTQHQAQSKLLSVDCFRRRGSLCLIKAERVILSSLLPSRILLSFAILSIKYRLKCSIEWTLDLDVCNALYKWQCRLQIIIAALGLAGG